MSPTIMPSTKTRSCLSRQSPVGQCISRVRYQSCIYIACADSLPRVLVGATRLFPPIKKKYHENKPSVVGVPLPHAATPGTTTNPLVVVLVLLVELREQAVAAANQASDGACEIGGKRGGKTGTNGLCHSTA